MKSVESITVDDRELELYVAAPDANPYPAVVLLHPWWGFNEFMWVVCDRLTDEGYIVVAPDLYGGTVATTIEAAEDIASHLDGTRAVEDITAALEYLYEYPHRRGGLGLTGFSMGAFYGLEVVRTRSSDVDVAVLFCGTRGGDYTDVTTAVLGHFAENDEVETPDDVEAFQDRLTAGGGCVTIHVYPGTEHWVLRG